MCVHVILTLCTSQGGAQEITLTVDPISVTSGEAVCPATNVYFNCIAEGVVFLRWLRNSEEIKVYIGQDNAPLQQQLPDYTVILNYSTSATQGLRNLTSTLVGAVGAGFRHGDQIECRDDSGQTRTLNFIQICK